MHLSEKCIWKNDVILFISLILYTRVNQDFWDTLRDAEFTLCATFLMGQWLNYEVRMWYLMFKFVLT